MVTGRCYQSNKKSYHQIRYQSDKLCKENNLSVIDEFYESYKKKYKTNGKSWYENEQAKHGSSWKSRLQFDIDRMIKQSKDWDEFLKKMALNPLNSLMSISKKQLMKGKIYKKKSRLFIRKYRSFLPLWSKFIPLKNTGRATKNIRLIHLTRHFLKSTKLRLLSMKMLFQSLKNPIPSSQIQRIF